MHLIYLSNVLSYCKMTIFRHPMVMWNFSAFNPGATRPKAFISLGTLWFNANPNIQTQSCIPCSLWEKNYTMLCLQKVWYIQIAGFSEGKKLSENATKCSNHCGVRNPKLPNDCNDIALYDRSVMILKQKAHFFQKETLCNSVRVPILLPIIWLVTNAKCRLMPQW